MLRFVLGTLVAGMGLAVIGALVDLYRPEEQAEDSTDAEATDEAVSTEAGSQAEEPLAA
jgi:hypothetical protein